MLWSAREAFACCRFSKIQLAKLSKQKVFVKLKNVSEKKKLGLVILSSINALFPQ
jgi:hypothetical protein